MVEVAVYGVLLCLHYTVRPNQLSIRHDHDLRSCRRLLGLIAEPSGGTYIQSAMAESPNAVVPFDFRIVHDGFASALVEDEDVDLQQYLLAYKELYK